MIEIECIEFLIVEKCSSKVRAKISSYKAQSGGFDEGSGKDSLMFDVLEKHMSFIDTDKCQIKVYADYIFGDNKIFVYLGNGEKKSCSLISIDKVVRLRDKIVEKKAPKKIIDWIDALSAKAHQKNTTKLVFH